MHVCVGVMFQFFCVFFMSVPPYVICFFFHTCIFSDWGHVQMYMIVLSFIFFFNYPRVSTRVEAFKGTQYSLIRKKNIFSTA